MKNISAVDALRELAPVICAQAYRQLQIELGPNQQVSILASGVG